MNSILQPWFTQDQIDRRTLWSWLQPDATRLAQRYWWGVRDLSELRGEMRLAAGRLVRLECGRGLHVTIREPSGRNAIADAVLEEEITSVRLQHEDSRDAMHDAALAALRGGADRDAVLDRVLQIAEARSPLPPEWLVEQVVEDAGREHRRAAVFWRSRLRSAA